METVVVEESTRRKWVKFLPGSLGGVCSVAVAISWYRHINYILYVK